MVRKMDRKVMGAKAEPLVSPNTRKISVAVFSASKRLSTKRTTAAEEFSCIHVSGNRAGKAGGESNVNSTSRNRAATVLH